MPEGFDMVNFLLELVRIPSESGYQGNTIVRRNYREIVALIEKTAVVSGLTVERLELLNGDIPSLVIGLPDAPRNKPSMAFVTHYDVVPAKGPWIVDGQQMDPYEPIVRDGKVYGRGGCGRQIGYRSRHGGACLS